MRQSWSQSWRGEIIGWVIDRGYDDRVDISIGIKFDIDDESKTGYYN